MPDDSSIHLTAKMEKSQVGRGVGSSFLEQIAGNDYVTKVLKIRKK
jgi:hypothetical protein